MELPASFIDYTRALLGDEEYDKLAVALQQEPPVSIRLNQLKINHSLSDKVPWSSEGFYLEERLTFTFDPLFHAGLLFAVRSTFSTVNDDSLPSPENVISSTPSPNTAVLYVSLSNVFLVLSKPVSDEFTLSHLIVPS